MVLVGLQKERDRDGEENRDEKVGVADYQTRAERETGLRKRREVT